MVPLLEINGQELIQTLGYVLQPYYKVKVIT